jgi:hypothetical protein
MDMELIAHTAHLLGEKNEHLANATNIFFSIALIHGGLTHAAPIVKRHIKRITEKRRNRKNGTGE